MSTFLGNWGMEAMVTALKDEKVSLSVLALLVGLALYAQTWANDRFAKQSEFDELKDLLIDHTEEFRINNASQIIRDLKTDLRIARATNAPSIEIDRLEDQLDHAEKYKECLVDRRPNCKHLREAE